jgi:hypothetical protein
VPLALPAPKIIDVNVDVTPALRRLRAAGVQTIFGYLNPLGQNEKVITPTRARAIANAGLRLGLVSEGWGDFLHRGISADAGRRDGLNALRWVPALGGTAKETVVYFAVDTDATWGQIICLVIPYFRAVTLAFNGGGRVGVYGSGAVCETLVQQRLVTHTWLAAPMGWLRSREYVLSQKWNMKQLLPRNVEGVQCDPNLAGEAGDIGDFVPYGAVNVA